MPDYMYMLESRLSAEQRAAVVRIQELAAATESNLYLTGGAVRDLICDNSKSLACPCFLRSSVSFEYS